jgi:hypothetical protein
MMKADVRKFMNGEERRKGAVEVLSQYLHS